MALNFAYLVPWQTLSTLSWHLLTYEPRVFLSSEVLCLLASTYHNPTGLPNSSLTVWQCPQSMLCLKIFFFNFPTCTDSPVLVVLVSLPHTSPSLLSVVSPATVLGKKRVWTKEYLEASKGGIQMLLMEVGSTWKHSVHLEKTLGRCSDAALWSNTLQVFSCCLSLSLAWPMSSVTWLVAVLLQHWKCLLPLSKWGAQSLLQRPKSTNYLCTQFQLIFISVAWISLHIWA